MKRTLIGFVLLSLGCGAGSETVEPGDETGAERDVSAMQMRDPGASPSGDLGAMSTRSAGGSAINTGESGSSSRPGNVNHDDPDGDPRPLVPSPADRSRIFERLRPELQRCLRGRSATFTAQLEVRSSGVVREALVRGPRIEGTSEAACMQSVLRSVIFPAFQDEQINIEHRYRFR